MREIWCFTIFSYLRLYSLSLSLPTLSNMFLFLQGDASSVGHGAVLNIVQEEEEASGCVLVKMHEGSRVEIFSFFTGVTHNCQWNPIPYLCLSHFVAGTDYSPYPSADVSLNNSHLAHWVMKLHAPCSQCEVSSSFLQQEYWLLV